jgi:hypothetical protein
MPSTSQSCSPRSSTDVLPWRKQQRRLWSLRFHGLECYDHGLLLCDDVYFDRSEHYAGTCCVNILGSCCTLKTQAPGCSRIFYPHSRLDGVTYQKAAQY